MREFHATYPLSSILLFTCPQMPLCLWSLLPQIYHSTSHSYSSLSSLRIRRQSKLLQWGPHYMSPNADNIYLSSIIGHQNDPIALLLISSIPERGTLPDIPLTWVPQAHLLADLPSYLCMVRCQMHLCRSRSISE